MEYYVRFHVTIYNKSWVDTLVEFIVHVLLPLAPLFSPIRFMVKKAVDGLHTVGELVAGVLLIPVGLLVMASLFAVPVVLFFAAMGWI